MALLKSRLNKLAFIGSYDHTMDQFECTPFSVTKVPQSAHLFVPKGGLQEGEACLTCATHQCPYWGLPKKDYGLGSAESPASMPAGDVGAPVGDAHVPVDNTAGMGDAGKASDEGDARSVGDAPGPDEAADVDMPASQVDELASDVDTPAPPSTQIPARVASPADMEVDSKDWDVLSQRPPLPSPFRSTILSGSSGQVPTGDGARLVEDLTRLQDDDVPAHLAKKLVSEVPPLTPGQSFKMLARMIQGPGIRFYELAQLLRKCYACSSILTSDAFVNHDCSSLPVANRMDDTLLLSAASTPARPVAGPSQSTRDVPATYLTPARLPSTAYQTPRRQSSTPSAGVPSVQAAHHTRSPLSLTPFPGAGPSGQVSTHPTPIRSSSVLSLESSSSPVVNRHTTTPTTPLATVQRRKLTMRALSHNPAAFSGNSAKDLTLFGPGTQARKRESQKDKGKAVDKGKGKATDQGMGRGRRVFSPDVIDLDPEPVGSTPVPVALPAPRWFVDLTQDEE
ncbi:hypothetical protein DENSPDRAFT_851422 [Dentipellis sp. KUC8613]|nr:hypothetical protein DENSPDRAFT_851422 [Dentipellis sp. KUC8613]